MWTAVVPSGSEHDGVVICFVAESESGLAGFTQAVGRFLETTDLSQLGHVRYAFAERGEDGETHVVLLWTDSELNISRMFPAVGDAEGSDSALLPRPPESRRTLSAGAEEMPYALRVYESSRPAESMRGFFAEWMKEHRWREAAAAPEEGTTTYFDPDGLQVFISIFEEKERTYVTLLEAGRPDSPPITTVEAEFVE